MKSCGRLTVIAGPMFSGKTEELIRLLKRAVIGKKKVQVFKHKIDIRYGYGQKLYSHSGLTFSANIVDSASDIEKQIHPKTLLVAIDEAQWFGQELIPIVLKILSTGIDVIISGLALTFDQQPFEPIPTLLTHADDITKLTAVCTLCGADAVYHIRVKKGAHADARLPDPSLVSTLKSSVYEARCRSCLYK